LRRADHNPTWPEGKGKSRSQRRAVVPGCTSQSSARRDWAPVARAASLLSPAQTCKCWPQIRGRPGRYPRPMLTTACCFQSPPTCQTGARTGGPGPHRGAGGSPIQWHEFLPNFPRPWNKRFGRATNRMWLARPTIVGKSALPLPRRWSAPMYSTHPLGLAVGRLRKQRVKLVARVERPRQGKFPRGRKHGCVARRTFRGGCCRCWLPGWFKQSPLHVPWAPRGSAQVLRSGSCFGGGADARARVWPLAMAVQAWRLLLGVQPGSGESQP
jgi:hypothetical protein